MSVNHNAIWARRLLQKTLGWGGIHFCVIQTNVCHDSASDYELMDFSTH